MRKLLLLSVLAVVALASSGFQIPSGAFPQLNCTWPAVYCAGYNNGAAIAGAILPSPAGIPTYQQYKAVFETLYRAQYDNNGVVLSGNVGYDNALEDGANYLWVFLPTSCHNIVCQ